jgi:hypothetical protein
MNRGEAFKQDTAFYADYDFSGWGVFGDHTGFCYALPSTWEEAEAIAKQLTEDKAHSA